MAVIFLSYFKKRFQSKQLKIATWKKTKNQTNKSRVVESFWIHEQIQLHWVLNHNRGYDEETTFRLREDREEDGLPAGWGKMDIQKKKMTFSPSLQRTPLTR